MTSRPNQSSPPPHHPAPSSARTTSLLLLPLLVGTTLLASGCYQRVVTDKNGTYSGDVHESNLPDDTRGFWVETFDPQGVPVRSSNARQSPSEAQKIYDAQLKDLDLQYRNRDD